MRGRPVGPVSPVGLLGALPLLGLLAGLPGVVVTAPASASTGVPASSVRVASGSVLGSAGAVRPAGAAVPVADPGRGRRLVTPRDARLTEVSGIVDRGATLVLTEDSGSCACLTVVSTRTGKTLGVTRWRARTRDVEALAPAGARAVWVGDIGDNRRERRRLTVYRVPVGTASRTSRAAAYSLAYPKGAHDAESLLVDRQGRAVVITKSFAGGTVYRTAGPPRRDRVNRLRPVGHVAELATDAALARDGRSVVVRGPGAASVYAYPSWRRLGSLALPRQQQGEGVSVGPGGRVLLASEGRRSPVLVLTPPAVLAAALAGRAAPTPSPTPSPSSSPTSSPTPTATATPSPAAARPRADADDRRDNGPSWLLAAIPAVIVVGALGIGLGLRRRSP